MAHGKDQRNGMNLRLKRTPGIYLAGFMGAGKSTVARHLAERLGWQFVDTDAEIEAKEQKRISEIFEARGEREFRRIETEAIRHHVRWIESGRPAVLALGGGAFTQAANRELMENNGITVWLDCPFEVVQRRVALQTHRPLARDPEAFAALYEARREHYRLADVHVLVESDDPEVTVSAILAHPLFQ
jgi:shikimate kinase